MAEIGDGRTDRDRRQITGEDNVTVFSYSGRLKSPEWRWQRRRADLRHFQIFRHGPKIIYTRLPAGGTYYPICTFPVSDAFSAFCLRVSVIFPTCSLYPPTKACLLCATPAGMDLYNIQVHARKFLPSAVPWISEDRLFSRARESLQGGKRKLHFSSCLCSSLSPSLLCRECNLFLRTLLHPSHMTDA